MSPNIVPHFAKRQAGKLANYFRARAQHEYNEMSLKLETCLWQSKNYAMSSAPVRMYTNLSKMIHSYRKITAKKAGIVAVSKTKIRSNDRGRINKAKKPRFECKRRSNIVREKCNTWMYESSRGPLAHVGDLTDTSTNTYPGVRPKTHYTVSKVQSEPTYMDFVRTLYPVSEDHEERRQRIMANLDSIPRPEGLNPDVWLLSGHSGIAEDTFLSKYYYEQQVDEINKLHRESQLKQRRQHEEYQHQAQAEEIEHIERLRVYEAACEIYHARVSRLAEFDPQLDTETTKLLSALDYNDPTSLEQAITTLVHQTLEPANQIFEDMKKEISLESLGADHIKTAWPLAKMEKVVETFNASNRSIFNDTFQHALDYMLQGFYAICQPLMVSGSLNNPLGVQSGVPMPEPALLEVRLPVPEGPNAGKNFSSFADLVQATKANSTARHQPQVPSIIATHLQEQGGAPPLGCAPGLPPSTSKEALTDSKVFVLLQHIEANILDFQDNLKNLVQSSSISVTRRKEIELLLNWLDEHANGAKGILPDSGDSADMKRDVQGLIVLLGNLRNRTEKNRTSTKVLVELAKRVEKIWM